ncbi:MAG TPA: cytochrome c [Bryobacteraceae bacterium]|nr:cytochrome c [Bryobacteraceae bacterium]
MSVRTTVLFAASIAIGALAAQNQPTIKKVPLPQTSPSSGQEMFEAYCSACHGKSGRGDGPAHTALKKAPADLTRLTVRNNGKFPDDRVAAVLTSGDAIDAHGSAEMPIWGDLFNHLKPNRNDLVQLRISNLVAYLQSIQAK